MEELIKEMQELNSLLMKRDEELDRRDKFDEEISKEIAVLLGNKQH